MGWGCERLILFSSFLLFVAFGDAEKREGFEVLSPDSGGGARGQLPDLKAYQTRLLSQQPDRSLPICTLNHAG